MVVGGSRVGVGERGGACGLNFSANEVFFFCAVLLVHQRSIFGVPLVCQWPMADEYSMGVFGGAPGKQGTRGTMTE